MSSVQPTPACQTSRGPKWQRAMRTARRLHRLLRQAAEVANDLLDQDQRLPPRTTEDCEFLEDLIRADLVGILWTIDTVAMTVDSATNGED